MTQDRAVHTRRRILSAASEEFAAAGFRGTSLARICERANLSTGALTFHFPSKQHLALAVVRLGHAVTEAAVDNAARRTAVPLTAVMNVTLALVRLLDEDPVVRAAARLAQEGPEAQQPWQSLWLPQLRCLVARAHCAGQLAEHTDPGDVLALAVHLVAGAECPGPGLAADDGQDLALRADRVWHLAAQGFAPAAPGPRTDPRPGP
ncbi:TetR/AcrR family transcriptional regulator [Streptomyces sp. NPDC059900]|uniref:TetR/AcrR family transcriptional regulator n=1 Tax=Streptomyces sp. NPDC059900 TaxID=3155816 RepID=UPI003448741C